MPMNEQKMAPIELSENHRRSVSITLQLVDQALCEWDDWANGRVRSGIMYRQLDTLSAIQKLELQKKVTKVRQPIVRLRDDLDLEPKNVATSQSIIGQASLLWEMLTELNARGLQGYGNAPADLGRYLDPIGEQLCFEVNEIARLFSISSAIRSQKQSHDENEPTIQS
jgi:hypothetical protein